MAEITRQVIASTDDCHRRLVADDWGLSVAWCMVGAFMSWERQYGCGIRFTNITIPQGATINNGTYLTFRCGIAKSGEDCNSRISAEDVDDAPTFADDDAAFDARWANRTAAKVDWKVPAWTVDVDYNSPEIKSVIQEIVNREGWNSGQDIVIFWEDFEDRSSPDADTVRFARSYDGSIEFAPKLHIEYTPPVVGWTGKISGVTNPAKIMGVDVANIKSVKGVE